jgi:DnaJ-class molecular chaperone
MALCPKCNGTGIHSCHRCHGTGRADGAEGTPAGSAVGAATASSPVINPVAADDPARCPSCHGVGTETCRTCDGAGDV